MEELLTFYTVNWKVVQSPLLQPCIPKVCVHNTRVSYLVSFTLTLVLNVMLTVWLLALAFFCLLHPKTNSVISF